MTAMTREEFQMALEELVMLARPDMLVRDMHYAMESLEEDLYGKRGVGDNPSKDLQGYSGFVGGEEV